MLSTYIPGYPGQAPQTSNELMSTSHKDIVGLELPEEEQQLVLKLRREFIDATHSSAEPQIHSVKELQEAIAQGYIRPSWTLAFSSARRAQAEGPCFTARRFDQGFRFDLLPRPGFGEPPCRP